MQPRRLRDIDWSNAGAILALSVFALATAWFILRDAERPGFLSPGVAECQHAYAKAHTSADTQMVNVMHPSTGPQKDPNAPTCGTLRRIGR